MNRDSESASKGGEVYNKDRERMSSHFNNMPPEDEHSFTKGRIRHRHTGLTLTRGVSRQSVLTCQQAT